jgi:hypothetical protein
MSEVFKKMEVYIVIFLIMTIIVSKEFATAIFRVLSTTGRNISSQVPHYMILLSESTAHLTGTCKSRRKLLLPAGEERNK